MSLAYTSPFTSRRYSGVVASRQPRA